MRILHVAHGFPPDQMAGAEVYTWTVTRELAPRGHEVHVLAPGAREGHPEHAGRWCGCRLGRRRRGLILGDFTVAHSSSVWRRILLVRRASAIVC